MNPFAILLDQSSALSAHTGRLCGLDRRVFKQLSKPPRVVPDAETARFDALVEAQEAVKEVRAQESQTPHRAGTPRTSEPKELSLEVHWG